MKKKTILILWIIGFVVSIIGAALFVPTILSVATNCVPNTPGATVSCPSSTSLSFSPLVLVGLVLLIAGSILAFIAWIGALVRSARMGSWVWFVLILIFSGIATLIYGLAGPPDATAPRSMG